MSTFIEELITLNILKDHKPALRLASNASMYHTIQTHLSTTSLSCLSTHVNELSPNAVPCRPDCADARSSCSSSPPPPRSRRPPWGSTSWSRDAPRQPPWFMMLEQVTFHLGSSGLLIGGRNICGKEDEKGSSTGQVQLICEPVVALI